ncbi:MAG: DEAD/DEAH box helicase [Myxococcales bacterium]|nr:DEAD/DEAH box helicase [Myxococcales bacterium]
MSFSAAHPSLRRALAARSYSEPTAVQAAVLGADATRDLLVSAQTGSGKTVAFGLALAPRLLGEAERIGPAGAPRALIIAPTRELAIQVQRELSWLYAETGARIVTCVGGMDPRRERDNLARGVHVVVGTPGRLCDHLERGALVLSKLEGVVLDEADEMLDMGFREELERLLDAAPAERRTLLFSATIPKEIAQIAKRYQKNAERIAATSEGERHRDIEYIAVTIVPRERDLAVVNLLRYFDAPGSLVFCATRDGVTRLAANLAERGFSVAALSGELSQRERSQALQALRDGRARVCVATDVAARGLDLPDLGLVIHADLPQNRDVLVHRSGRTGRAGKKGTAIVVVPDPARRHMERMFHGARIEPSWRPPPSADDIRTRDQDQLVLEIRALAEAPSDDDRAVAHTLLADRSAEQLVAALVAQRRQARPAPEELTLAPSLRPAPARREREREQAPSPRKGPPPREREREQPRRDVRREPSASRGNAVWFTVNVGRSKNADPKWLVPLLCRRGRIGKQAIGKIQILARETRVEIAADAAERFAAAVREPDAKDKNVHIEPVDGDIT